MVPEIHDLFVIKFHGNALLKWKNNPTCLQDLFPFFYINDEDATIFAETKN